MLGKKILFWSLMFVVLLGAGLAVTAEDKYAYPVHQVNPQNGTVPQRGHYGMTLREYYAGQALQGIAANMGSSSSGPDTAGPLAWQYADAVLKNEKK